MGISLYEMLSSFRCSSVGDLSSTECCELSWNNVQMKAPTTVKTSLGFEMRNIINKKSFAITFGANNIRILMTCFVQYLTVFTRSVKLHPDYK